MRTYIFIALFIAVVSANKYAYLISDSPLQYKNGALVMAETATVVTVESCTATSCNATANQCCAEASTNITLSNGTSSTSSSYICVTNSTANTTSTAVTDSTSGTTTKIHFSACLYSSNIVLNFVGLVSLMLALFQ